MPSQRLGRQREAGPFTSSRRAAAGAASLRALVGFASPSPAPPASLPRRPCGLPRSAVSSGALSTRAGHGRPQVRVSALRVSVPGRDIEPDRIEEWQALRSALGDSPPSATNAARPGNAPDHPPAPPVRPLAGSVAAPCLADRRAAARGFRGISSPPSFVVGLRYSTDPLPPPSIRSALGGGRATDRRVTNKRGAPEMRPVQSSGGPSGRGGLLALCLRQGTVCSLGRGSKQAG